MFNRTFLTSSPSINVAVGALLKCAPKVMRDFGEIPFLQNSSKSNNSFVQASLTRLQKNLAQSLSTSWPSANIYGSGRLIYQGFQGEAGERGNEESNPYPRDSSDKEGYVAPSQEYQLDHEKDTNSRENALENKRGGLEDKNLASSHHKERGEHHAKQEKILEPQEIYIEITGLANFAHGIPHFGLAIVLEKNTICYGGAIVDPLRDEIFWTHEQHGSFLNKVRLKVAERNFFDLPLLSFHVPQDLSQEKLNGFFSFIQRSFGAIPRHMRHSGATTLDFAYIAAGRIDGFVGFFDDSSLKKNPCWRLGALMVKEARGVLQNFSVTPPSSGPVYTFLGGSPLIKSWMNECALF